MNEPSSGVDDERFVSLVTENQNRINAYIYSLLGDMNQAADVLQETNLVLWRRKNEFRMQKPFIPWAFAIARYQVLAHLRDHRRERCLLSDDLVEALAVEAERQASSFEETRMALRECLTRLPKKHQELVRMRYFDAKPIAELAGALNRGLSDIKVTLLRARKQLAECIRLKVSGDSASGL